MQSLLTWPGLIEADYTQRFGSTVLADFACLQVLLELGWASQAAGCFALTDTGMARSDAIGPWLQSDAVTASMNAYALR